MLKRNFDLVVKIAGVHSSLAELTDFITAAQISKDADVLLGELPDRVTFLSFHILESKF